ncbi:MAG TPA: aminotransferase class I/II-fold pyridoxal phosphate-dependent enzyme [Myxococcaceae bacterium]|nr:aminotransferase class I/II-fold pyridoxal phosphate-dependent enzyme [Myxococcaceae bacterium]
MAGKAQRMETQLVHAGELGTRVLGAVSMPVFQSSTYETGEGGAGYHDVRYIRLNNTPNHLVLHGKLAALESGEAAVVTASGMAAISTTLLALLSPGVHLLVQDCLYGGTHDLVTKDFAGMGITHAALDLNQPATWEQALRPRTKAIYVESLTNPLLQVGDLEAAARFAREKGLVAIIDNTFATPVNYRPLERGFHLSLHSCTKYMNGHSDIVAGAVIGPAGLVEKVKHKLDHLGGSLDPHACFLLHRGMKTLALRVRYQNESALKLARFLEQQPAVAKVNYPGLETHPHHARARQLFAGFGGMLSFELKGGVEAAERFLKRTELGTVAPSLGGPETLVTRPVTTSHAGMSPEERKRAGISDGLVRVSVGLEATEDLMEDFGAALG